ncbi:serine hydrolase domain-containing protein [Klenkia taihuensis]|uniref:CubicO group peptidase, beta-lactamase class C family n=1 Tax=Klenkia taihuensis TaxID=1225127 RepID=A0A1I1QC91_9ACTN|nr:serine hydrolase domain-containing protein [Klenkia taihuensis]GHE08234.1 serine hydrolase [Klenkia taihuensis]SFD15730.1 CubicO group peptidase, beta-lactamase class C family [Klenkia taihuensis]
MRTHELFTLVDDQVTAGRYPGAVVAVRHAGTTAVHATGTLAVGGGDPVTPATPFRLASVTKPFGGVLALSLVADGTVGLDDDVARWLPELAAPRVLRHPGAELTDTVAAEQPVTVRDLLRMTCGAGLLMDESPLAHAMWERGVSPGPLPPRHDPDTWVARLAALPLADQPGQGWRYHTGSDLLGVLLARAAGRPLPELLAERVTGPLGLTGTGFRTGRPLPVQYAPTDAGLDVLDPADGVWSAAPVFPSLGGGLVGTAADVCAFLGAVADDALPAGVRAADVLHDGLTGPQRAAAQAFLGPGRTWATGNLELTLEVTDPWTTPGRFGWTGGTGTTAYCDPSLDLVAVLLTQRMMTGPHDGPEEFWQAAHDAVS